MRILGNITWLVFGGLKAAIIYFTGSLALAITIIGLPWALQTFKIGLFCLWPFGANVTKNNKPNGCMSIFLNVMWIVFGGLGACLWHVGCGMLLCLTIIGLTLGKQHFKMAKLALAPFGKDVSLNL